MTLGARARYDAHGGVVGEVVGEVGLEVQQLPEPVHRVRVRTHPAVFVDDVRGDELIRATPLRRRQDCGVLRDDDLHRYS